MSGGQNITAAPVHRRAIEALLVGIDRDESARACLREAGYDLSDDRAMWPAETFYAVLEWVRGRRFAGLPVPEAQRALGRVWVEGFAETTVGSVVMGALRVLGPERALPRILQYVDSVRQGFAVQVVPVTEREYRIRFQEAAGVLPEFAQGGVEAMLRTGKSPPSLSVELGDRGADWFELRVRW
jgi:uncharacterized protein (TIGR02265 family)